MIDLNPRPDVQIADCKLTPHKTFSLRKSSLMSQPSLRVFPSNHLDRRQQRELDQVTGVAQPKRVSVPLSKVVPLLMEAAETNRAWLHDFADDKVEIDADLFDVLMAYHSMRGTAAA